MSLKTLDPRSIRAASWQTFTINRPSEIAEHWPQITKDYLTDIFELLPYTSVRALVGKMPEGQENITLTVDVTQAGLAELHKLTGHYGTALPWGNFRLDTNIIHDFKALGRMAPSQQEKA